MDPMGYKHSSSPSDPKDNDMSAKHRAARDKVKKISGLKAKLIAASALNPKHADEHIQRLRPGDGDKYNGPHASAHIDTLVPNAQKLTSILRQELKKAGYK